VTLTDANSWLCKVHTALRCRVWPRTAEALEKHYRDAYLHGLCPHIQERRHCRVCMNRNRKGGREGRTRVKQPQAIVNQNWGNRF
jgi:recombinational DNA repair protein RecR